MSGCCPDLGKPWTDGFSRPRRVVDRVFLHCSTVKRTTVDAREVDRWVARNTNGWDCIGYHFFIRTDGTVEHGRSLERDPAAQAGNNRGTIAICLNGLDVEDFGPEQLRACLRLCSEINRAYGGEVTFHGHCEVGAKACPVFDYKKLLALDARGYMVDLDAG